MIDRQGASRNTHWVPVLLASSHHQQTEDRLTATLQLTGRMEYGCHRARGSIISTGGENVSHTAFRTMKPIRIASTATRLCRCIRTRAVCCGWELKTQDSIFSISGKNSSAITDIVPVTPIASRPAG